MADQDLTQEQDMQAIYGFVVEQMQKGASPEKIKRTLMERGVSASLATIAVNNIKREKTKAVRAQAMQNMLYGALWCIGGIVVTAVTLSAASGPGGGRYVVAWGAILFGGIQFFRGLIQSITA